MEWLLFKNNFYKNDIILSERSIKTLTFYIQDCIDNEFSARENIELYCNINNVTKVIHSLEAKHSYPCEVCVELNYLSYLECVICKKRTCISHFITCKCPQKSIALYYRHKNDLYYYSKNKKPSNNNNNSNATCNSNLNSNYLQMNNLNNLNNTSNNTFYLNLSQKNTGNNYSNQQNNINNNNNNTIINNNLNSTSNSNFNINYSVNSGGNLKESNNENIDLGNSVNS